MGKVIAAAAAAIALGPFSVLASTPGVAQAAPWAPCAGVGADSVACPKLSASGGAIPYFDATRVLRSRVPPGPGAPEQGAGADSGGSAGARTDDRDAGADPTGRSAKFPAPEDDSDGGRSGGAHPTLVALWAALRGVGDSSVLCRLDDPSFRENVKRAPDG
jgi:hypothetical protein